MLVSPRKGVIYGGSEMGGGVPESVMTDDNLTPLAPLSASERGVNNQN